MARLNHTMNDEEAEGIKIIMEGSMPLLTHANFHYLQQPIFLTPTVSIASLICISINNLMVVVLANLHVGMLYPNM